jgi:hypothetical protein
MVNVPFTTHGKAPIDMRVFFGKGILGVQSMEARIIEPFPTRQASEELWKALMWIAGLSTVAVLWYLCFRRSGRMVRS